jgi:hypothetical protein
VTDRAHPRDPELRSSGWSGAEQPIPGVTFRPVREKRAAYVKPSPFARGCARCGTSFLATEGGAAERGPWADGMRWYCSTQCLEGA